jgi:predicted ferric reductase
MSTAAVRGRAIGHELLVLISSAVTGTIIGLVVARVSGDRMAPWILGRATGVCSYLLLTALVVLGLTLSHPRRAERGRTAMLRMRAHIVLSLLTLALTVLHIVVLATDRYAGVGWWGAALPMGAQYRPVAVTLGVIGAWIGVLAGLSAGVAGRLPRRAWWPLHKVAAVSYVLIWLHGVYAGSDTRPLLGLYLGTGALVLMVAVGRYTARRPGVLSDSEAAG